ncbi:protein phosphatase 2C-like domain-containing protein 1 [Symsagittifera roscoffensis]|uniref:protein phosphatase 2C-like domain-containing protein 1 n=1 Tax=Symsagittifera roscoffensis TaxID=84072 RepID=UPI00307C24B5
MNSNPEYSVTIVDRSVAAVENKPERTLASGMDSYPTHSMFNLETPFYPITPDIPDRCEKCGFHVRMSLKYDHDLFHRALNTLGYKGTDWPSEIEDLIEKRRQVVNEATKKFETAKQAKQGSKNAKYKEKFLQFVTEVNIAFSVVKMYIEDEYEIGQKPHSTVYVAAKTNVTIPYKEANSNVLLTAMLNEPNLRWQSQLLNHSVYIDDLLGSFPDEVLTEYALSNVNDPEILKRSVQFMGLYSGYNGEAASHLCYARFHQEMATRFHNLIARYARSDFSVRKVDIELSRTRMMKLKNSDYGKAVKNCFVETFQRIDDLLCMGEGESSTVRWSGVSVSTCLFEKHDGILFVHVANCGDNRVLACRDGEAIRLSKTHVMETQSERKRFEEKPECRKYMKKVGRSHATRGLGNLGDKILRQVAIPVPSCASYVLDDSTEFILIGSRGLFNVLSESQCIKICKSVLPKYFMEIKKSVEEHLVSEDEDLNRNKTVTFQSPSRIQEILQGNSKELDSSFSEEKQNEVEKSEENRNDLDVEPSEKDKHQQNGIESSEGSPIVSRVHSPSNSTQNGSEVVEERHVSESEVFKGLTLKALRGELSNVTVDARTDWYQYLPSIAKNICEKICLSAMKNGCKENVSCALIFLPAIKRRVDFDETDE